LIDATAIALGGKSIETLSWKRVDMDKYYLVEVQRFVDGGGKLTHEQGLSFLDEFLRQGGKLSHEQSVTLLHMLGALLKHRKPRRLRLVNAATSTAHSALRKFSKR
jgi:hypothetical protein